MPIIVRRIQAPTPGALARWFVPPDAVLVETPAGLKLVSVRVPTPTPTPWVRHFVPPVEAIGVETPHGLKLVAVRSQMQTSAALSRWFVPPDAVPEVAAPWMAGDGSAGFRVLND